MKRRTFLIGTGSAAIGGSALLGSGAFSRVESQRSVTIQVAEDPDAYLGMDKCSIDGSETPNSSYAHLDDKGHIEILMNPDNPTIGDSYLGEGINSDSRLWADNVFQICNQGKEQVCVYIEDDAEWPYAPEPYGDERRVDFYVGEDREGSIVGIDNAIHLPLGDCVCIGLKTNSKELSEGDELLEELDNEITIVADVDDFCKEEEPECPELTGEYECTTYEPNDPEDPDEWTRSGTRFRIFNMADSGTDFDLAVSNQPGAWRDDVAIGPNTNRAVISDASVPVAGLVIWDVPDECVFEEVEVVEWGDFKDGNNSFDEEFDDLIDWYESTGTATAPDDAPQDLDDDTFVSELQEIPEDEEPDQVIDDEDFPDMDDDAEAAGWITCAKEGDD